MPFVPFVRTPLTDLTGTFLTSQRSAPCHGVEMKMINCLEAYGMHIGMEKCSALLEDFQECVSQDKQMSRLREMCQERERQQAVGGGQYLPEPRLDAFQ